MSGWDMARAPDTIHTFSSWRARGCVGALQPRGSPRSTPTVRQPPYVAPKISGANAGTKQETVQTPGPNDVTWSPGDPRPLASSADDVIGAGSPPPHSPPPGLVGPIHVGRTGAPAPSHLRGAESGRRGRGRAEGGGPGAGLQGAAAASTAAYNSQAATGAEGTAARWASRTAARPRPAPLRP